MRATIAHSRRTLLRGVGFCLLLACASDDLRGSDLEWSAAHPASVLEAWDAGNATAALLTVTRAGSGRGRVVSRPTGIVCGSDCTEAYPIGTFITLRARPFEGSAFTGWSGPCSGLDPCTVEMQFHRTVTATFAGTF